MLPFRDDGANDNNDNNKRIHRTTQHRTKGKIEPRLSWIHDDDDTDDGAEDDRKKLSLSMSRCNENIVLAEIDDGECHNLCAKEQVPPALVIRSWPGRRSDSHVGAYDAHRISTVDRQSDRFHRYGHPTRSAFGKTCHDDRDHHHHLIEEVIPSVIRLVTTPNGNDDDVSDVSVGGNDDEEHDDDDNNVIATATSAILKQRQQSDMKQMKMIHDDLEEYLVSCYLLDDDNKQNVDMDNDDGGDHDAHLVRKNDNSDDNVDHREGSVRHDDSYSRAAMADRQPSTPPPSENDRSGGHHTTDHRPQQPHASSGQDVVVIVPAVDSSSSFGQEMPSPVLLSSYDIGTSTSSSSMMVTNDHRECDPWNNNNHNKPNDMSTKRRKKTMEHGSCQSHVHSTSLCLEETETASYGSSWLSASSAMMSVHRDDDEEDIMDPHHCLPGHYHVNDDGTDSSVGKEKIADMIHYDNDDIGPVTPSNKNNDSSFLFQSFASSWSHQQQHPRYSSITHSSTWGMTTVTLEDDDTLDDDRDRNIMTSTYQNNNRHRSRTMSSSHSDIEQTTTTCGIDHMMMPMSLLRLSTV